MIKKVIRNKYHHDRHNILLSEKKRREKHMAPSFLLIGYIVDGQVIRSVNRPKKDFIDRCFGFRFTVGAVFKKENSVREIPPRSLI